VTQKSAATWEAVSVVTITLRITYDPAKRLATWLERGLDFEDARAVLMGPRFEFEDCRKDYGEIRILCYGYLKNEMVVVGYVERELSTHVFSMRKANAREKKRFGSSFGL
jgi:uncharacterized DUF497 family protein